MQKPTLSILLLASMAIMVGCGEDPMAFHKSQSNTLHTSRQLCLTGTAGCNGGVIVCPDVTRPAPACHYEAKVSLSLALPAGWQAYRLPAPDETNTDQQAVEYMNSPAASPGCYLQASLRPPTDLRKTPKDFQTIAKQHAGKGQLGQLANGTHWYLYSDKQFGMPVLMASGPNLSAGYPGWMLGVDIIGQQEYDAVKQGDGQITQEVSNQSQTCDNSINRAQAKQLLRSLAPQVQVSASAPVN